MMTWGWYLLKIFSCIAVAWLLYLPFEARTATVRKWLHGRFDKRDLSKRVEATPSSLG